jgi:hypothetical protein
MYIIALRIIFLAALSSALPSSFRKSIPSEANVQVETDPEGITWPWRVFKSSSAKPPDMVITANGEPLADGFIFQTPSTTNTSIPYAKESMPFIRDSQGDLIFALNITGANDFRRQFYNGKPYLTYWSGYNSEGTNIGHGYGETTFLDDKYQPLVVNPDLGLNKLTETEDPSWSIDIHEQQLTHRNTLLISAYNNTPHDLTSVGGSEDGWIVDGVIVELDIETQEVLFSWRAIDHLPLNASHQPLTGRVVTGTEEAPWDWFVGCLSDPSACVRRY